MASTSSSHQHNAPSGIDLPNKRRKVDESSRVFDVFINHRGPDVKLTLATQLYNSLKGLNIKAFLDAPEKERGVSFPSAIETAIRSASVHIAIFSKEYAGSDWCLRELVLMFQSKAKIIPVFYQVQPWELRYIKKGVYAKAFAKYKKKNRYPDKIEEWKEALKKASKITGDVFENADSSNLKAIVSAVEREVLRTKRLHVANHPVGLNKLVRDFERRCLGEIVEDFESQCGMKKANVVGIYGMGGVGKTTLAIELFNKKRCKYTRASFLFDVREACANGKLASLQSRLLRDIFCENKKFLSSEEGKNILRDRFERSSSFDSSQGTSCSEPLERSSSFGFLIVLDDIDNLEQLDSLLFMDILNKAGNNLVIITTREVGVLTSARIDNVFPLKGLEAKDGRELFCWHAFGQAHPFSGYKDLVQGFIEIFGGLPLSLQVLGRHVYLQDRSFWQGALKKARKALPGDVNKRLKITFDSLDYEQKQVFMDIACFFIGKSIAMAITIWKGSGWSGHHALKTLKDKCLVEENVTYMPFLEWELKWKSSEDEFAFRMHDHLRDLGREMANDRSNPRRWWHPQQHLKSLELEGFRYILKQTEGRCFHSFLDETMNCQITYFIGEPEDSSETSLLWLQLDYLKQRHVIDSSEIPSWINLQNLKCLRISNGRFKRLWQRDAEPPSHLIELQVRQTLVEERPDLLENLNNLQELEITWKK